MADAAIIATASIRLKVSGHPNDMRRLLRQESYNLWVQESRGDLFHHSNTNVTDQLQHDITRKNTPLYRLAKPAAASVITMHHDQLPRTPTDADLSVQRIRCLRVSEELDPSTLLTKESV